MKQKKMIENLNSFLFYDAFLFWIKVYYLYIRRPSDLKSIRISDRETLIINSPRYDFSSPILKNSFQ